MIVMRRLAIVFVVLAAIHTIERVASPGIPRVEIRPAAHQPRVGESPRMGSIP